MAFDTFGNLSLADVFNNAVRVLDNTLPTVTATAATTDGQPCASAPGPTRRHHD